MGDQMNEGQEQPGRSADGFQTTLTYCVMTRDGVVLPPGAHGTLAELDPNTSIQDRYEVLSELGRGGMGCVYLARDTRLDRLVAIKVVAGPVHTWGESDPLVHEARLGAGLNHPAIAAVFDFFVQGQQAFTVFEYVDGDSLRDLLRGRAQMTLADVRAVIGSLARALDFAHSRGIVHRDLKPENVRASKQGLFKILDLGLAQEFRLHQQWGVFAGTPAYASPEQAAGLPADGRSDQYALAVMAYEMLSGSRPFEHEHPQELLRLHRSESAPPLDQRVSDVPGVAHAAIMRALDKDPQQRFASCAEFAAALGSPELADDRHRVVVHPLQADRTNVYICHAGENAFMARQLAHAMQQEGYSCWQYEHDALPGISHVRQTSSAIRAADAVALLISPESLNSPDVGREIQEAYQSGRPFLPILVGLTRQEFCQRQPDWQPMIGPAAMIDVTASTVASATARLLKTLQLWGVTPRPRVATQSPAAPDAVAGPAPGGPARKIWASDANQIEIGDLDAVVFRNPAVDDFLERRNKFFLSASKGLGKTLLLTYKRLRLTESLRQQKRSESSSGVLFVPQGRPYLDFMSDVRSLSKHHDQLLSDLPNAKRIWYLALAVSTLSHFGALIGPDDEAEVSRFPRRLQTWLRGAGIEPTVVFKEILTLTVREINRLIDDTENFLDAKLRQVHGGTYFFVDKVDQALRRLSQDAWLYVQAGLIEAAWDLMNANSHIKIHASIRQEAFSNYHSAIKSNLFGATTLIQYAEDELQQMLDQLARCYEGCNSFKEFITLHVVRHPRRPYPEDSFRYVRRHSLGRPRDLVIIASELSTKRQTMNETRFRNLVNETAARALVANIFDEMRVFLNCLFDRAQRQRFLRLLPSNILTRDEVVDVCCEFNGLPPQSVEYLETNAEGLYHPFCDLYQVGLLGTVTREPDSGRMVQKFKQPHDFIVDTPCALPHSPYYLIHPALDDHIRQLRTAPPYGLFQHITVGDGQVWEEYFGTLCHVERCLFSIEDNVVCDATYRLLNEARLVLDSERRIHLRSVMEAADDLALLRRRCSEHGYDDLGYWLEELIEC